MMGKEETPAKYGPVTLGERTSAGLFSLEAPANFGFPVTFASVIFKPHAAYMVRAINCHDDLLAACKAQHQAIDILLAMLAWVDPTFFPSKSGIPWDAVLAGNDAVRKAEGSDCAGDGTPAVAYWPDLTLLPAGWRLACLFWAAGNVLAMLENEHDERDVFSEGNHPTPAGAFADACARAKAAS